MFGTTKKEPEKPAPLTGEQQAEALIPGLLADKDSRLDDLLSHHVLDFQSYSCDAERFADYLSLKIRRGKKCWAGAINIKEADSIELELGHPVQHETVKFEGTYDFGYDSYRMSVRFVQALLGSKAGERLFYPEVVRDTGLSRWYSSYNASVSTTLPDYPVPATDDRLLFHTAKATLFCPHGHGEQLYSAILKAIKS